MKPFNIFLAAVFAFVTAGLHSGLASDVHAQGREGAIHVCVAEDGVLRLAAVDSMCPAGQKSLYLATGGDLANKSAAPKPDDPQSASLQRRLVELEQRVKDLEDAAGRGELGQKVVAPFEVVDRSGKRIFSVEDGNARYVNLFNRDGKQVAGIGATAPGGYFFASSATSDLFARVTAEGSSSGVTVEENEVIRLDLGRDKGKGTYRLKFFTNAGTDVAGIGESTETKGGLAVIQDESGRTRASIGVRSGEGGGGIFIHNSRGTMVAGLTEGSAKSGLLLINSSAGQPMVEAGVTAEGFGVVRAGPEGFKPGVGILGLPGSYIAGKPQ